jgi:hypothetical protein
MRRSNLTEGSNPSLSATFIFNELQGFDGHTDNGTDNKSIPSRGRPRMFFELPDPPPSNFANGDEFSSDTLIEVSP